MGALQLKKLAAALGADATIHIFATSTTDLVEGLVDLSGNPLDNPFTVAQAGGVEHWGCVVLDDRLRYDAWWAEAGENIALAEGGTLPMAVTQAQAEDAADVNLYSWMPQRIWQAVIKWAATATSVFSGILKGATEAQNPQIDATAGGTYDLNFSQGSVQIILMGANNATFQMGTGWPADESASMILSVEQTGIAGSIGSATFTGFPEIKVAPDFQGITPDAGEGNYVIRNFGHKTAIVTWLET